MAAKFIGAWSWSRIEMFEQCPRKFELNNIIKPSNFAFVENDVTKRGKRVHKDLERALGGEELPEDLKHVKPIVDKILAKFKDVQPERQVCWDKDKIASDWFDARRTMFRAELDVLAVNGTEAIIYDWKTGKVRDKPDQLKLYAAVVFMLYPEVQKVHTAFIFVDHQQVRDAIYTRDQFQKIWHSFEERADLILAAHEENRWPPRKNYLCNWCDATPTQCPYGNK